MRQIYRFPWQTIILILLCIFLLINHALYVFHTHQYPEMDEQHYMEMSTQFYRLLQHPTNTTFVDMLKVLPFRQPGYAFFITPFIFIFGIRHAYQIALLINGLFFCISIVGIYFLSREFFSKNISLMASILFTSFGWTLFYLHFTYSETATTCFVILSLFFLKKSNYLASTKFTLLFGFAFALGLLVRWVTPIFISGPFILTLIQAFKKTQHKIIILRNIFIIIIFILPVSIVYFINAQVLFGQYFKDQFLGGQVWETVPYYRKTHLSLQSAAYYFKVFEQLNIFFFLLFIIGSIQALLSKKQTYLFLILAFILPYALFSFATIIKDDRYIVPLYPTIAILSVTAIAKIKNLFYKNLCIIFFLIISTASFFGGLWGIGPMGKGLQSISIPFPFTHARLVHFSSMVWPPRKEVTNVETIFSTIETDSEQNKIKHPKIMIFFSYHPVDNAMYAINRYETEIPYDFFIFVGMSKINDHTADDIINKINSSDYILFKKNNVIDDYFPKENYLVLNKTLQACKTAFHLIPPQFKLLKTVFVPLDKTDINIYKKISRLSKSQEDSFRMAFNQK